MIMKEHAVLQEHIIKEKNLWESSNYLCLSFLIDLEPQRQGVYLTDSTSYLSQSYSLITYTSNRLSIELSNKKIN